ncbi:type I polyketide synthase [Nocardiopsis sp. YSL2]|uniref:type I polyketide synthase n=1 Tax=Nocardiopsis sp. YSL2 TaxID=2939492 RepID=UPI0026F44283|nr:type I polyketide synthase [Nocardiopsis sp. YSL2]
MTVRATARVREPERDTGDRIAVIGMAVRLPGAEDVDDLGWLLSEDRHEVRPVPAGRWARDLYPGVPGQGAFLPDAYCFDHERFGLSAEQAVRLDPQHRLMLEVGAVALEDSGLLADGAGRRTGVFVGSRMNSYGFEHGRSEGPGRGPERAAALWGRSQNFAAAWLSDRLDLHGPSLVVDTACSSSLTALWLACQSLAAGGCRTALVGGVDLLVDPLTLAMLTNAEALSPQGRCRTFDERADGYVPGEGAVALVLKPLRAALDDGDTVLASIVASAVNNDGSTMGVTTPSLDAQVDLLSEVYARVDAATVGYVEAHGTGTAIGDPIEVRALSEVFGRADARRGSVALGSLKRRIGHLHSAAGLAGVAKAVHVVRSRTVPPTAVARPNPRLRLADSPFHLPEREERWGVDGPRRAAVSAFGFGGTNAHAVVEEPPEPPEHEPTPALPGPLVLPLSADTPEGLRELAAQWLERLEEARDAADLCATAQVGRPHRRVRAVVRGNDAPELAAALRSRLLSPDFPGTPEGGVRGVDFRVPRADAPPEWFARLCSAHPPVEEVVTSFEGAAGLGRADFTGRLLELSLGIALATALRESGVDGESVDLPEEWRPVAAHVWEGAPLEETVARLLGRERDASDSRPCTGPVGRLADPGADPADVLDAVVAELYERGHRIDWSRRRRGGSRIRALLPREQAHGPHLDLAEPHRSAEPGGPVRSESVDGAAYAFSRVFGPGEEPIAQHSVHGDFMLPGVGWLDFLEQGVRARGEHFGGLEDLVFHRPLVPADGARRVLCSVGADGRFEVRGDDGTLFVTGRFVDPDEENGGRTEPLTDLLAECSAPRSGSGIYRWLRRIGYRHGRYYRNISWVAARPGGTLARIEGGRQRVLNPDRTRLYPGLLDSVTIAAISPDNPVFGQKDAPAFIPLSIGRLTVLGSLAEAAFVRTDVAFWNDEACRCTQVVTDARGRVLLVLADITAKRVAPTAFTEDRAPAEDTVGAPKPPPPPRLAPTAGAVGTPDPAARALAWFLAVTGIREEDADTELLSAGYDSAGLVELSDRLSREYGLDLYPTEFFEFPTPRDFARDLAERGPDVVAGLTVPTDPARGDAAPEETASAAPPEQVPPVPEAVAGAARPASGADEAVEPPPVAAPPPAGAAEAAGAGGAPAAVIGTAFTLPCGDSAEEFWDLLRDGRASVGPLPGSRDGSAFGPDRPHASYLERVDLFDPGPFRLSPREAPLIDPQARLLYETVWRALEDSGRMGERARKDRTGLWVAYSHDHYHEERQRAGIPDGRGLGLEAMIPNRLSHLMDWTGPSVLVNTLCSSSLVALHQAVRHLRTGEVDTAVVAGVHAGLSPEYFRSMRDLGALSPTGLCRTFDTEADGMVPGEGALAVVLRRLDAAVDDRDRVHAVIRGTAVNHGGRTTRYSAPSPRGQRDVVSAALRDAGVDAGTVTMVEAHGTGTPLGDPIEVEALTEAFRADTDRRQFCAIGSVKSNIGHLEPAAGLAGLAKVVLAMRHRVIPATLHVERPNPHIDFASSPFFAVGESVAWEPPAGVPRRAGLSAFGMGGVNAHVVVEEPPVLPDRTSDLPQQAHLLRVSATDEPTVRRLAADYADAVGGAERPGDFAFTVDTARPSYRHGAVVVAEPGDVERELRAVASGEVAVTAVRNRSVPTAFVFTGQGSQHWGMGRALYAAEPVYREAIDECEELLGGHVSVPLREVLFGDDRALLDRTGFAQVAIVSTQVALTRLLRGWGVVPQVAIGHSLGELSAAWACGVFGLGDLLRLTAVRARLMQARPSQGSMAAVTGPVEETVRLLGEFPEVEVASFNSADHVTVTGPSGQVARLVEGLGARRARLLNVSHAFHSAHMEGAVGPFAEVLAQTPMRVPGVPLVNGLTGRWHTEESVTDPGTWAAQVRRPVRFREGVEAVRAFGVGHFWEVGPQPHLTPHVRATVGQAGAGWYTTLRRNHPEQRGLMEQAAKYHRESGAELRWSAFHEGKGDSLTGVPGRPMRRRSFWIPSPEKTDAPVFTQNTDGSNGSRRPSNGNLRSHPLLGDLDIREGAQYVQ